MLVVQDPGQFIETYLSLPRQFWQKRC